MRRRTEGPGVDGVITIAGVMTVLLMVMDSPPTNFLNNAP